MTTWDEQRAYKLRCEAEVIEARNRLVTVEISEAAAWLFRDMLGLGRVPKTGLSLQEDMLRLNEAVGHRKSAARGQLPEPHVSGWSKKVVEDHIT